MRPVPRKANSSALRRFALAALFFHASAQFASSQMGSGSYKIPVDSLNVGGGASGSTSYDLFGTVGESGTGDSSSASYRLNAGFLGSQSVYISLTAANDITMSPSINGISGGTGSGSTTWTVVTDNPAGYSLNVRSSTSPALRSASSSFADYSTAGASPDYTWNVAASDSEFGFTPEGSDVVQTYLDNGSACSTGSSNTADRCWDSFSTSDKTIAQKSSANHPSGTSTTVKVQAEVGNNHIKPHGSYTSSIQVTVIPL